MKRIGLVLIVISLMLAGMAHAGTRIGVLNDRFGSAATIGMSFNENMSGDVGLAIAQDAGGSNTNIAIVGRFESKIAKFGKIQAHAGGHLIFASDPNYTGGDSSVALNGYAGIAYPLDKNLEIIADIRLIEITSFGGSTSFGILSGTPFPGTGRGAANATIYSGARLYI